MKPSDGIMQWQIKFAMLNCLSVETGRQEENVSSGHLFSNCRHCFTIWKHLKKEVSSKKNQPLRRVMQKFPVNIGINDF